jgi:sialate O-acetylesterase
MKRVLLSLVFAATVLPGVLLALEMPSIFSDHMVLQRDKSVRIWGTGEPESTVEVSFGKATVSATVDLDGHWQALLPPFPANSDPQILRVSDGQDIRVFEDVLVGEVWLASGQSNMEKPIGEMRGQRPLPNHRTEIAMANHPQLRLFQVPRHGKAKEGDDAVLRWLPCSPESIAATNFSAVGYYFGRELLYDLDVPIGIIHSSFGGSMIEAWIPRFALEDNTELAHVLQEKYFAWVEGVQATELFESMIAPLVPISLRGFIWYQGEANAMNGEAETYTSKMGALIKGWRSLWDSPEAPFYFVQLAPFNYSDWLKFPAWLTPEGLPLFREAQTNALAIPYTGMVVTTDLAGDARDIHPVDKAPVGQRLAHLALAETYGRAEIVGLSPQREKVDFLEDGSVRIHFKNTGGGLARSDPGPLSHFTIAGKNREFVPATARIVGKDTVVVSSSRIPHPEAVRFAWHETAAPNLVNSAGLPAIPFRTDDWPVRNTRPKPDTDSDTD